MYRPLAAIILVACAIIATNSIRNIVESYNVGITYEARKTQLEQRYLQLIKKKNELDYINTSYFSEKQIRESLNYYKPGEKLVLFSGKPTLPNEKVEVVQKEPTALEYWTAVGLYGVKGVPQEW